MTNIDTHGLPVSTSSDESARLYREGVALMFSVWPEAAEKFDAAIEHDPDFALAHAARARLHATYAQSAEARKSIAIAQEKVGQKGSEREASHVAALALAVTGQPKSALHHALAHADRWPRDIIILSLPLGAFGLYAFSGMADHNQAKVDLCERFAAQFTADDWWFLTYRGWSLAENGEVSRGRTMLERTIELRPDNANAAHALAHAMYEGGANDDAGALITGWLPRYDRSGILHGHIAWHGALVALERGDAETALSIYRDTVQPSVSLGMPINVVSDAASLLWRVQAYGHTVPEGLWQEAAAYAAQAFPKPGHSFVDPHMALLEAATGNTQALNKRIAALEAMVAEKKLAAGAVVPAFSRAANAFAEENYAVCVEKLEPVVSDFARIGGSNAQRDVMEDMLLVALMRSGEVKKAHALLKRRLDRRPSPRDTLWLAQLKM